MTMQWHQRWKDEWHLADFSDLTLEERVQLYPENKIRESIVISDTEYFEVILFDNSSYLYHYKLMPVEK